MNLFLLSTVYAQKVPEEVFCDGKNGINTAIGCIHFGDTSFLAAKSVSLAIGVAGLIALLLISYASFLLMTSAGDPKKVSGAKELLYSALSGLILIILSVFVLRLIGSDLLNLFT